MLRLFVQYHFNPVEGACTFMGIVAGSANWSEYPINMFPIVLDQGQSPLSIHTQIWCVEQCILKEHTEAALTNWR